MLEELIAAVRAGYSGVAAKEQVAAISRFHRLQASPGFRAAAEYCLGQLKAWGVDAEILSFPANEETTFWTCRSFREWDATEATLDLVLPEGGLRRLADYREDKISLIQRSLPFEGEVEVVVVDGGASEADYEGLDVEGKVVLTGDDIRQVYALAVQSRGAVGILFDGMRDAPPVRQRIDLPDARQYTSFWWCPGDEPRCFGFVLTPRQGDELRTMARRLAREGRGPLRVRAKVASRLYDGRLEVVSALIPGETDEEVLAVAHLCHPQASANDNASGSGAILEAARTLRALIDSGRLPQPRRSIRFLWVPEMTGTYAYLAAREDSLERMVAGINLDMVGQDQSQCGSSFIIERPPEAMASFGADLAEALRDALQEGATTLSGTGSYPLYRQAVTSFSGGSDHCILSDPTVGVPTPMLIQWPDRYYHTSSDTIDKVDPQMLAVAGRLATAYTYYIAAAGTAEVRWLAREMAARAKGALARTAQDGYTATLAAGSPEAQARAAGLALRRVAFRADRAVAGLASLRRLAPEADPAVVEDAARAVRVAEAQERQSLERALAQLRIAPEAQGADDAWAAQAEEITLRRLVRGPVAQRDLMMRLAPDDQAGLMALSRTRGMQAYSLPELAMAWMDGRRNLREIADLVECEVGLRDLEFLVRMAEFLERAGVVERANLEIVPA